MMKPACIYMSIAITACVGTIAVASPQVNDRLVYGGHEYVIFQIPMLGLWHYGDGEPPNGKLRPPAFEFTSFNNWAGYFAKWEIRDKELLLRTLRGRLNGNDVQNEAILSRNKFPVKATWFSGRIYLLIGDFSEDKQVFEAVIVFEIDKGNVKSMSFLPSAKISLAWNGL
jgi:hypothetical protein